MSDSDDSAAFRFTKEEMQLLTLHRAFLLSACAQAQPAAVVDIIVAYWCPAMAALRHTVGMGKRGTASKSKKKADKQEVKAVTEEEETTEVGEEETPGESEENTEESPKKPTTQSPKKPTTLDKEENGDKDNKEEQTVEALRKQVAELQKQVGQLSKGRDRGRTRDWMNDEQLKDIQNVKDQHKP